MDNPVLFNVNGAIGRGAYAEPDYPTAESLVEHLDYLGVDRSLAWHVAARDLNPTRGNRLLLEETRRAGLEKRILPAFIVTPACFYEYGALDFLRESFASGQVRALRITPDTSRFPVREIERVLGELARFEPALFWDCRHGHNELDIRDIEHLAGTFPGITIVLTQKMWGGFHSVLDLMWRRANVCLDTSWLHMRDTIELLVDNFGAERVLFGLGYRSHYGAAIAALAHARLEDRQREMIAHENAERILGIEPLHGKLAGPSPLLGRKPLWEACRAGRPLEGVEVIDAHGHTPPHTRGWVIRSQGDEDGIADLLGRMDRLGINKIIVAPETALFGECAAGNREAESLLSGRPERFSGWLCFNPLYAGEMTPLFDSFFERNFFIGFKILPSYWKIPLGDPGYRPVWEYADARRLPILIHTWNDSYNSPRMLAGIAPRFPGAAFILGHSGGGTPGRLEAEELALAYDNVHLEFCGSFTTPRPFEKSIGIVGRERVLFGTDADAHDPAWELGRYLSMPLPDEELLPGLGENIRRIISRSKRP